MNLVLHHLAKDIRALRWPLTLWALSLLVAMILDALVFQPDYDFAQRIEAIRMSPFPFLLGFVLWTLLLARLVQSEPATGANSFWLTRPIPRHVRLLSKGLFIFLLIILPSLVPLFFHGFQLRTDAAVVAQNLQKLLILEFIGTLFIIWIATFYPNLVHFAGIACLVGVGLVLVTVLKRILPFQSSYPGYLGIMGLLSGYSASVLIAGLILSLIYQQFARASSVGFVMGITAIVLTGAVELFLPDAPWSIKDTPFFPQPSFFPYKTVKVEIASDWLNHFSWSKTSLDNKGLADIGKALLNPVAPNSSGVPVFLTSRAQFQLSGGENMLFGYLCSQPDGGYVVDQSASMKMLQKMVPPIPLDVPHKIASAGPVVRRPFSLFCIDPALKQKLQGKTGTLTVVVTGRMMSFDIIAKVPLGNPHFIARLPGGFIRVGLLDPKSNAKLTVWRVSSSNPSDSSYPDTLFMLVDPQKHNAKMLREIRYSSSSSGILGIEFSLETSLDTFESEPLERMDLYVLETTEGDWFENTLVAPNFTMNPSPETAKP